MADPKGSDLDTLQAKIKKNTKRIEISLISQ